MGDGKSERGTDKTDPNIHDTDRYFVESSKWTRHTPETDQSTFSCTGYEYYQTDDAKFSGNVTV